MENQPKHTFIFSQGTQDIRDYHINYNLISMDHKVEFKQLFPRVGHLVCNLFIGNEIRCRYLNYSQQKYHHNQLYIAGLFSKGPMEFQIKNKGKGYAIKIHPVIGHHLLKIPMTELTDHRVRVSDALNIHDGLLRRLENNEEITSIENRHLQHFFWSALPNKEVFLHDPIYHAVNTIAAKKGKIRIKDLASQFCMSSRTFRRQFLYKVGLSPQSYARIWKVREAIEHIRNNPTMGLAEVAWRAGYYDIAHLAHDFKHNVQLAPSNLTENFSDLAREYFDTDPLTH